MGKLKCLKDMTMEDGTTAFHSSHDYEWRWATRKEEEYFGRYPLYVFKSEIGDHHYMSYRDVEEYFS